MLRTNYFVLKKDKFIKREFSTILYVVIATYLCDTQREMTTNHVLSWSCTLYVTLAHLSLLFGCHLTLYATIAAYKVAIYPLPFIKSIMVILIIFIMAK